MNLKSWWWASLGVLAVAWSASAHSVGESYIVLDSQPERLEGRLEARLQDLMEVIPGFDQNGDGKATPEEFGPVASDVRDYLVERFQLTMGGEPLTLEFGEPKALEIEIGKFAVMPFHADRALDGELEVHYTGFFDVLPHHRGLLIFEYDHATGVSNTTEAVSLVFSGANTHQSLAAGKSSGWAEFVSFVREGIHHIWIGLDHVLFLLVLILPSVMQRKNGKWVAVTEFRPALLHVVKVVTIFTIAHSITLSLAALGVVNLHSRLVESIIAASVVVAALNGGFLGLSIWPVLFLFGLFHGFGFASVMGHLPIDQRYLLPALFGFNVGVEIGQIAIILLAFPILWVIRNWRLYPGLILQTGSIAIALLAFVWLVERALDVTVLGIF